MSIKLKRVHRELSLTQLESIVVVDWQMLKCGRRLAPCFTAVTAVIGRLVPWIPDWQADHRGNNQSGSLSFFLSLSLSLSKKVLSDWAVSRLALCVCWKMRAPVTRYLFLCITSRCRLITHTCLKYTNTQMKMDGRSLSHYLPTCRLISLLKIKPNLSYSWKLL